MSITYVTTQTAPVIANAGITSTTNISVSSPSALNIAAAAAQTNSATLQTGPGWATPTGSSSPGTTTSSTTVTNLTTLLSANWPVWLVIAALAWFGFKKAGG